MCTTLIVPGLNGSGDGHWQHYWLQDDDRARLVDQDNWQCPVLDDWMRRFEHALAETDHAYIVAHSLGCMLVANMARRPLAKKIKGALLVAPAHLGRVEALHPCIVSFGEAPADPLPFPSVVVGSTNDPYMDVGNLGQAASGWGSDLVNLGSVGHINIASGFGRWQQGYGLLDRLVDPRDQGRATVRTTMARANETALRQHVAS
ncbi:alpha/beta hydrolase [Agrobacterium sp. rho-13.3]|uniref:alpha/beta hydrolase n=1 Tax=Agrobacterium sp. rho-13.3 TaxID=3072980 RepID=UPI002A109B55|nr:alpha/beta hydrolase [Agrobacterium sp. rho-13.3]MDX8306609.1 alpha/beta hydrolase [Agrobacterium sp. rho-13.3]MDX8307060.1 alpha/beta hydrolase [Agrobacterium sp. rho-13.3]